MSVWRGRYRPKMAYSCRCFWPRPGKKSDTTHHCFPSSLCQTSLITVPFFSSIETQEPPQHMCTTTPCSCEAKLICHSCPGQNPPKATGELYKAVFNQLFNCGPSLDQSNSKRKTERLLGVKEENLISSTQLFKGSSPCSKVDQTKRPVLSIIVLNTRLTGLSVI